VVLEESGKLAGGRLGFMRKANREQRFAVDSLTWKASIS